MSLTFADPILVTGATGLIGNRVVARLLREGVQTRALLLPNDASPADWGDAVDVRRGDVTDALSVRRAMEGARTVVHLAARVGDWDAPSAYEQVTVRGTEHVLGAAATAGARAVLASSVVVYGHHLGEKVCDEEHPMGRAMGPYSRSKQEQEHIARRLEGLQGLKVTIVRPGNVYGPGSLHWVDLAVNHLRAERPCLVGGGHALAGLGYVDNVADVFVLAAGHAAAIGRTYNANDDLKVTWRRYFTELAELAGAPPPRAMPRSVARLASVMLDKGYRALRRRQRPPLTREAFNLVASNHRVPIARARRDLGYAPAVSYEQGMNAVAAYLQARASA